MPTPPARGRRSACLVLEIDDFARPGRTGTARPPRTTVLRRHAATGCCRRCATATAVARIGDSRFAVCLTPVRQLDLEPCIQLAGRMQAAVAEPMLARRDHGLCRPARSASACAAARRADRRRRLAAAATAALAEARSNGPSAIRAFSRRDAAPDPRRRADLRDEAAAALENGQIRPWFQPQISTDTGQVTGFEALARWHHPDHAA